MEEEEEAKTTFWPNFVFSLRVSKNEMKGYAARPSYCSRSLHVSTLCAYVCVKRSRKIGKGPFVQEGTPLLLCASIVGITVVQLQHLFVLYN